MSALRIRSLARRWRGHASALAVVFVLGCAIAVHHAAPAMVGDHHGMDMGAAIEMCVAAFTAVGAILVAAAIGVIALGRRSFHRRPLLSSFVAARRPLPRARAGPAVLCVMRR